MRVAGLGWATRDGAAGCWLLVVLVRTEYETVALPVHEHSFIRVLEEEEEEEELLCTHPHRGSILFTLSSWPRAVV